MGKQCPLVALIPLHLQNAVFGVPGVAVCSFQVPYCYWEDKFSLHQFRSRGVGEELESYLTTDYSRKDKVCEVSIPTNGSKEGQERGLPLDNLGLFEKQMKV